MSDHLHLDSIGNNRAAFLRLTGLGLGLGAACLAAPPALTARAAGGPPRSASTPGEAMTELVDGDARFTAGAPVNCASHTSRMAQLGEGQNPHAIILGCSDSRVPNDTIFDQAPGNIFSVRVAGNYVTADGLGSMEYGVAVLKALLIVVLGHSGCGAAKAAMGFVKDGTSQPGNIQDVVLGLAPAAKAAQNQPGDWLTNTIAQNVKMNVAALTARSKILLDAQTSGAIKIVGGVYDIQTARVAFFE
jgi:carbonic anhydrase